MNLEYFGLLKSFGELPALNRFEFQVSQELKKALENNRNKWHGFVKTMQNFIHHERMASEGNAMHLCAKIDRLEQSLSQAMTKQLPEVTAEIKTKVTAISTELGTVRQNVQSLIDSKKEKDVEK